MGIDWGEVFRPDVPLIELFIRVVGVGSFTIGVADDDQLTVSLGGSGRSGGGLPVVAPAIAFAVSESGPGSGTKIAWR